MFSFTSQPTLATFNGRSIEIGNRCFLGDTLRTRSSGGNTESWFSRQPVLAVGQQPFSEQNTASENGNSIPTSPDERNQFDQTLAALKQKVSSIPKRDSTLDKIISQEYEDTELKPEQVLSTILDSGGGDTAEDKSEDIWDAEQNVIMSLLEEEKMPTSSLHETADLASITEAVESIWLSEKSKVGDPDVTSDPINRYSTYEPAHNSRSKQIISMKHRMNAVKRRRQRIRAESNSMESDHALDTTSPLADALFGIDRERTKNLPVSSLSSSRVVDFASASSASRSGALTAAAERLTQELSRYPLSFKPFFGMQEAFDRLANPPCPRCGLPSIPWTIQKDSLCQNCYREIFLEHDPPTDIEEVGLAYEDEETRAERKHQEACTAADAVALSKTFLRMPGDDSGGLMGKAGPNMNQSRPNQRSAATESKSSAFGSKQSFNSRIYGDSGGESPPQSSQSRRGDSWNVQASVRSLRTINPIRNLIQNMKVEPNPDKELIKLSIGDPTVYGNLKVSERAIERYCESIRSYTVNGYSMSMGSIEARTAVAKRYSTPQSPLSADEVFLAGGASGALELAIGAIANEGDNLLLPRPGFPLFVTIAENYGIECRFYRVNPDRNWEVELSDLIELADNRTAAILVNNPSNPCGSVYSESHIEDLLATAAAIKVPIIADEVYSDMVFDGRPFTSVGSKSIDVPVLCVGAISKQFVVPGWRIGWILMHDRNGVFEAGNVPKGIRQLTTRMLVPNTPAQAVLPALLQHGTRDPAFLAVMDELEINARFTVQSLAKAKGLRVIEPQGAMYVMVEVDVGLLGFKDDMEFTEKLMEEESVFVLPGQCFQATNFVRIVFSAPQEVLSDAFFRIRSFCSRHAGGM